MSVAVVRGEERALQGLVMVVRVRWVSVSEVRAKELGGMVQMVKEDLERTEMEEERGVVQGQPEG